MTSPRSRRQGQTKLSRKMIALGVVAIVITLAVVVGWHLAEDEPALAEAPEADAVLEVQQHLPFQILIPLYLPKGFDRASVNITVDQGGPNGEPVVELAYRMRRGQTINIRQWVPLNPDLETLAGSKPIETKWGKGWLLTQARGVIALWVDIGPLRASIYSHDQDVLTREKILQIAETMGPASRRQVFTFEVPKPEIREIPPPPPFEPEINEDGVQEFTLTITPGGYSPMRINVKKGIPVKLHFRALGEVGCGNTLILPIGGASAQSVTLESEQDEKIVEFTPQQAGAFTFFCGHYMYRGILTVVE